MGAKLAEQPHRFDFFQAVRLLEKLFPERQPVGRFVHPNSEVARFSAHASLAFPASQIQSMDSSADAAPRLSVNFMGLTGPLGVLPHPYTTLLIERLRANDHSMQDFFDIFNHRIISIFYRAWRKYRFDVASEHGERDRFSRQLLSLVGLGTDGLQDRQAIPDDALVFYAGLLSRQPRSAQALQQILTDYFDVPVEIEQFVGEWYALDPDTQCMFDEGNSASEELGFGAVVGDAIWNQQCECRGSGKISPYENFGRIINWRLRPLGDNQ